MKKTIAIILAIALLCIMAVGTTLTYFTDDDSDVNTMTVGKVDIEQYEKDRNDVNINNDSLTLYPVTANPDSTTKLVPVANNGVDKFVTVKNVGSEAAYVRTVFAFEMMRVDNKWVNPLVENNDVTAVHIVDNNGKIQFQKVNNNEYMIIYKNSNGYSEDETNATAAYVIGVCTYNNVLAGNANAITEPSLQQVYLDSEVGNEFSDAVGGSYEILVLSQAVQAQGFTGDGMGAEYALNTAFGEVNAANAADWFTNLPNN